MTSRVAIERGQVASAPPGAVGIEQIERLQWIDTALPNTAAGALRAAGLWNWDAKRDFDAEDWWWRIALPPVEVPSTIVCDGIATLWDAWIDGKPAGSGDNMFVRNTIEVTPGARELVFRCRALNAELAKKRPRPRWRVPMVAHQQLRWFRTTLLGRTPGWSPPCAAVGPWRPIWIAKGAWIGDEVLSVDTSLDGRDGVVTASAILDRDVARVEAIVARDGRELRIAVERTSAFGASVDAPPTRLGDGKSFWLAKQTIERPALWWPHTHGEPALYTVRFIVTDKHGASRVVDRHPCAFRSIKVDRRDGRDFEVRVNDVPVFCRGACWTPLDVVTLASSAERYRAAVAQLRDAGMNMVRVGGTMVYEDRAFYDVLDEQGILLWQDLMFANMDYPDETIARAHLELIHQLHELHGHPCVTVLSGNSEGAQQAAMSGASRDRWQFEAFDKRITSMSDVLLDVEYVPSSTDGGAFPHQPNHGVSSYYGVGAYMRPLEDARRSEVVFASECLAFANIPTDPALPRVHEPAWKARSPRDLGAGWDFDDVRDHYMKLLYNVDPVALRVSDHDRYLALGRVTTGEVMAQTFAEWRRARSKTRGALIWFLRDLWPGAGWGVVDAHGVPKAAWYALRRALQPVAIAITNEGNNGLAIHVVNDRPDVLWAQLELTLWKAGHVQVGRVTKDIAAVPAHGAIEIDAASLFDGWMDLSFAYRFGPPVAELVHAAITPKDGDRVLAETFCFPAGVPATKEPDVGLAVSCKHIELDYVLSISAQRFAQHVFIEAPRYIPDDNFFHLAPGQSRRVHLRPDPNAPAPVAAPRGLVTALNSEVGARFEVT